MLCFGRIETQRDRTAVGTLLLSSCAYRGSGDVGQAIGSNFQEKGMATGMLWKWIRE